MIASQNGHLEVAGLLIESRAKLDLQTKNGRSALHIASGKGHSNVAELIEKALVNQ